MLHDRFLVIRGQRVVAAQPNHGRHLAEVVVALSAVTGGAGDVGPVRVGHRPEELEVVEAELSDGAPAAAGPPALERVGGAGGHLLGTELHQLPGGEEVVGLHLGGEGEGPAAPAGSLVLHTRHGPGLHPVDGVGQLPGDVPLLLHSPHGRGQAGGEGLQPQVSLLELFLGQVSELIDAFGVRRLPVIVSLNLSKIGLENFQSVNFLIEAAVTFVVFQFEISEFLQDIFISQSESQSN